MVILRRSSYVANTYNNSLKMSYKAKYTIMNRHYCSCTISKFQLNKIVVEFWTSSELDLMSEVQKWHRGVNKSKLWIPTYYLQDTGSNSQKNILHRNMKLKMYVS